MAEDNFNHALQVVETQLTTSETALTLIEQICKFLSHMFNFVGPSASQLHVNTVYKLFRLFVHRNNWISKFLDISKFISCMSQMLAEFSVKPAYLKLNIPSGAGKCYNGKKKLISNLMFSSADILELYLILEMHEDWSDKLEELVGSMANNESSHKDFIPSHYEKSHPPSHFHNRRNINNNNHKPNQFYGGGENTQRNSESYRSGEYRNSSGGYRNGSGRGNDTDIFNTSAEDYVLKPINSRASSKPLHNIQITASVDPKSKPPLVTTEEMQKKIAHNYKISENMRKDAERQKRKMEEERRLVTQKRKEAERLEAEAKKSYERAKNVEKLKRDVITQEWKEQQRHQISLFYNTMNAGSKGSNSSMIKQIEAEKKRKMKKEKSKSRPAKIQKSSSENETLKVVDEPKNTNNPKPEVSMKPICTESFRTQMISCGKSTNSTRKMIGNSENYTSFNKSLLFFIQSSFFYQIGEVKVNCHTTKLCTENENMNFSCSFSHSENKSFELIPNWNFQLTEELQSYFLSTETWYFAFMRLFTNDNNFTKMPKVSINFRSSKGSKYYEPHKGMLVYQSLKERDFPLITKVRKAVQVKLKEKFNFMRVQVFA